MVGDNPKRRRRSVMKAVGGLTLGTSLAGCTGQQGGDGGDGGDGGTVNSTTTQSGEWPDHSGKEVKILTESSQDAAKEFFSAMADEFKSETGGTVNMEYIGTGESSVQRISQLLQAGDPPELFQMVSLDMTRFRNQGVLEPVTDLVERLQADYGELPPAGRIMIDGEHWFVPLMFTPGSYFYREDISDVVPDTWDNMIEYARDAHQFNGSNSYGAYVPAGSGSHSAVRFYFLMLGIDANLATWENDQLKISFHEGENRQKTIRVLEHIKELHKYSPPASDSSWTTIGNAISNGNVGMNWYGGFVPEIQCSPLRDDREFSDSVRAVLPEGPAGRGGNNVTEGMGIFKGSNVEAAKTWIEMAAQPQFMSEFIWSLEYAQNIPAFPGIKNGDRYQELMGETVDYFGEEDLDVYMNDTVDLGTSLVGYTDPANPYGGATLFSPPIWNMQTDVLINDANPEDILDQYAQELQAAVDEAQN